MAGAWQGHGGRARQGGMTGGMAGEHDRGMTGGTSSLPRITASHHCHAPLPTNSHLTPPPPHSALSAHTLTYLVCVLGEGGGNAMGDTMHGTMHGMHGIHYAWWYHSRTPSHIIPHSRPSNISLMHHCHASLPCITAMHHCHASLPCITAMRHCHASLPRVTAMHHCHASLHTLAHSRTPSHIRSPFFFLLLFIIIICYYYHLMVCGVCVWCV